MTKAFAFVVTWAVYWLLWVAFTSSLDPQELAAGAVVAAVVALMAGTGDGGTLRLLQPKRLIALLLYVPYLLWAIVKANLQVARLVVDPKMPIKPGIVKIKTGLTDPVARMALANSITLTPGTLTVEADGDTFYIHWIVVESEDLEEATRTIVGGFEKRLEAIFG